ncbi:hypothetical protein P879_11284 [Paragonimus westermani]|uniref:Uncharacterized protein n=1 Tax=Paragonimus westermani TaxID=34504 RepID=A0A8T0D2W9_9TREM|nr:hypothetical protein P879_11284 [Paragonimus westermani]
MSMQSAVAPTPSRPGQCSLCGQRVPIPLDIPGEAAFLLPSTYGFVPSLLDSPLCSDFSHDSLVGLPTVIASSCFVFPPGDRLPPCTLVIATSFFVSSPSPVESVHCKHFASQFSFHADQLDVYSQTIFPRSDCSCETETFGLVSSSTSCDDLPGSMRVLFQNLSITDYRDRLVEHHYYAPTRESLLVADCTTQFSGPATLFGHFEDSTSELLRARQRLRDFLSMDVYNAGVDFGVFAEKACGTDSFVEEVLPTDRMELHAQMTRAECSNEVSTQTTDCVDLQLLLSQFDVTEVWEAVRSVTSDYDYYQTLRQSSIVREQTCTTDGELTLLADIGIQVDIAGFTVRESSSSPDVYSGTSEVESNNYESYLLRSRLGQVREEQTYMAPLVNQASTQTEASSFSLFSEFKSEGGVYESTETYDYRLLRDEIAEAWTQWDTDFDANEMDDLNREDADNLTEESYLEIINKRRKKVYSQVEITEETDMVVCELGVQVDPDHFVGDTADNWTTMKHVQQANQELQTDPIHLNSVHHSTDLSWADPSLYAVILAGIDASRIRAHEDTRIRLGNETVDAEMLAAVGCQTSPVRHLVPTKEVSHWTEVNTINQSLCERTMAELDSFVDKEIFVRPFSPESIQASNYSDLPTMIVQLRQRTVQYELLETGTQLVEAEWNNIREVASPSTGLFAPVALAIRRGWIRLGEHNEYVDPTTGDAIPLATAYQMGRIRLASTQNSLGRIAEPSIPILLLIERTYFSWRKTKLVSVEDTARGDVLTPEAAIQTGILEVTGSEIRFLDTMTDTWLTIEEGVGRQMIQVVAVEASSGSTSSEEEEPSSCRVFQLTHVCPGGEPCVWMAPLEAVRLGLFNWETGDVAADWPTRPLLRHLDPTGEIPTTAFVPSKWCSFLTARHAGWLRLTEEEPSKWIVTHSVPYQEPNAVLLSRQINLVAYASTPVEGISDRIDRGIVSLQRARSDDVFAGTTPSTSERPILMHYLSDAFGSTRSRSDYQIHMKTNMEYELHLTSTVKEKDQLNELQAESYRITEAITLLSELASRDKEKMNGLLQQLRLWNRQQPNNIMGKCSPPASSSGEILTSSSSEISGTELSETESEIISEVAYESSKMTHFTKEYHPTMTYVLPTIFTYDEQSLSDEIGFIGEVSGHEVPPSRVAEDDYFGSQALHKWRFENKSVEDVESTETESVNSDVPAHYISTKHLPMGMTLDSDLALQSGTKAFKSRRQINTTDMDSSYSVVYIEVARSDPAMQDEQLGENLRADQMSKEVQVDQRVLTPRVRKIVELREVEEEAESSVLKQQKRTKIIPVRIKKQEASTQVQCAHTDIAVDARPCRREAASMISDKDEIAECYQFVPIPHISSILTPTLMERPEARHINIIPTQKDPRFPLMVPEAFYHISTQESAGTRSTQRSEKETPEKVHTYTQTDVRKMSRTFVEVEKQEHEKQGTQTTTISTVTQTESTDTHEIKQQETAAQHSEKPGGKTEEKEHGKTRERAVTTMRHPKRYSGGEQENKNGNKRSPTTSGKCSHCGQRVPSPPDRPSEAAVPVPVSGADRPALTDVGVGSDVAFPDSVEQGVGVVTVRRVDGTMQTRPVVAFYVDAEGVAHCRFTRSGCNRIG